MAKKLAIPEDLRDYPEYEYRPFPRYVGRDENGADLIANSEQEYDLLVERRVYPMLLGKDLKGNEIHSNHPNETRMKRSLVVKPAEGTEAEAEKSDKVRLAELERQNAEMKAQLANGRTEPAPASTAANAPTPDAGEIARSMGEDAPTPSSDPPPSVDPTEAALKAKAEELGKPVEKLTNKERADALKNVK